MFHYATHASHCFLLDLPVGNGTDKLSHTRAHVNICLLLTVSTISLQSVAGFSVGSHLSSVATSSLVPPHVARASARGKRVRGSGRWKEEVGGGVSGRERRGGGKGGPREGGGGGKVTCGPTWPLSLKHQKL